MRHTHSILEQKNSENDIFKINVNLKLRSIEFDNSKLKEEVHKLNIRNSLLLEENKSLTLLNERVSKDNNVLRQQANFMNSSEIQFEKLEPIKQENIHQNKTGQQSFESSSHSSSGKVIGYYKSNGSQNGKPLFHGPKDGIYFWNGNNNITYLPTLQKKQNAIYI